MNGNGPPALELQALTKRYPNGTLANDGVTLSVKHVDRTGRTVREESWENLGFSEDGRNALPLMFGAGVSAA